jgi:predicted nucleic acid-binding protein
MGQGVIMEGFILPDIDVLVDFLRGHAKGMAFVNTHASRIILSSIVVAELFAGVRGRDEQAALEDFVSLFSVVPVTAEIARAGGLYKRDFGASHGVGLADAIIAATAQVEKAALKTLNIRHYPMIKGLKPAYTK